MKNTDNLGMGPARASVSDRRQFMVGILLAGAAAASYAALPKVRYPRINKHLFESWIPKRFGPWAIDANGDVVLPPPDALSDRLYDNLVSRTYAAPDGATVMMVIAYNNKQDGVLQLHRPEICYPAGGFRLSSTQQLTLALAPARRIPGNFFTAQGNQRTEQVVYWTRLGDSFPQGWREQRLRVMEANLHGNIPDGVLMRVSLVGSDPARARDQLMGFLKDFINASPPQLRQVLIGG